MAAGVTAYTCFCFIAFAGIHAELLWSDDSEDAILAGFAERCSRQDMKQIRDTKAKLSKRLRPIGFDVQLVSCRKVNSIQVYLLCRSLDTLRHMRDV